MIFAFFIQAAFCCRPLVEERNLFPTLGEYYTIGMDQLFSQDCEKFSCQGCTNGISVNNATNIMYTQNLDYNFSQVIQNYTHFAGLAYNLLVIYEKVPNSFEIQQVQLINTPEDYNCINLVFTENNSIILLDCYQQGGLMAFFQLIDQQFVQTYIVKSSQPKTSQFQHYYNSNKEYILYAQYYSGQNSILTLFKYNGKIYVNKSTYNCNQNFSNFQSTLNFIYIQYISYLYQISFSDDMQFQCSNNYIELPSEITTFNSYFSIQKAALNDIVLILVEQQIYKFIVGFSYNISNSIQLSLKSYNYNIKVNEDFIFVWNNFTLSILRNDISNELLQIIELPEKSIIVFDDSQNLVYIFGKEYSSIKIQIPQLKINTTFLEQNYINISIFAESLFHNCSSNFSITVLNDSDKNIYLQFKSQDVVFYESIQYDEQINQYSGQLLNYNQFNVNSDLGYFENTTVQELNIQINQVYSFCQILQIPSQQYFINVCAFNNSLDYYQYILRDNFQQFGIRKSIPLKFQYQLILQIELAYNLSNDTIIGVLLNTSQIACVFVPINQGLYSNISSYIYVDNSIVSYFVNYAGLFILLSNQSINFYSNFLQGQVLTIDQNLINKKFNQNTNYSFNPIGMTQNIQFLSSILFINNQSNVLIISIIQNQTIPITRIQNILNNTNSIYGINIVNERLIVTYYQNYLVSFYVWNLYNIYKPYYEKQLMAIYTYNLIKIFLIIYFFMCNSMNLNYIYIIQHYLNIQLYQLIYHLVEMHFQFQLLILYILMLILLIHRELNPFQVVIIASTQLTQQFKFHLF